TRKPHFFSFLARLLERHRRRRHGIPICLGSARLLWFSSCLQAAQHLGVAAARAAAPLPFEPVEPGVVGPRFEPAAEALRRIVREASASSRPASGAPSGSCPRRLPLAGATGGTRSKSAAHSARRTHSKPPGPWGLGGVAPAAWCWSAPLGRTSLVILFRGGKPKSDSLLRKSPTRPESSWFRHSAGPFIVFRDKVQEELKLADGQKQKLSEKLLDHVQETMKVFDRIKDLRHPKGGSCRHRFPRRAFPRWARRPQTRPALDALPAGAAGQAPTLSALTSRAPWPAISSRATSWLACLSPG